MEILIFVSIALSILFVFTTLFIADTIIESRKYEAELIKNSKEIYFVKNLQMNTHKNFPIATREKVIISKGYTSNKRVADYLIK